MRNNNRNIKNILITIKFKELLVISFIFCLCLLGSFIFGFRSGKHTGFNTALDMSAVNLKRFPIMDEQINSLDEEDVSNVYTRLNESGVIYDNDSEDINIDAPKVELNIVNKKASLAAENYKIVTKAEKEATPTVTPTIFPMKVIKKKEKIVAEKEIKKKSEVSTKKNIKAVVKEKEVQKKNEVKKEVQKKKEVPKKKIDKLVEQSIKTGWYVQVSTVTKSTEANKLVNLLRESGFIGKIQEIKSDQGSFYRVLVGPEKLKKHADILYNQLGREQYIINKPFIREVK